MIDGLSGKNLFNFYYLTEISIVNFSKRFNILSKISLDIDRAESLDPITYCCAIHEAHRNRSSSIDLVSTSHLNSCFPVSHGRY